MAEVGYGALSLALVLAGYASLGSFIGKAKGLPELVRSARYATYLLPLVLAVATGTLVAAFVRHDFSIQYVAMHSNRHMEPWLYWVAFYAGNEGSLLFLAMVFSALAAAAVRWTPARAQDSLPYTNGVLMATLAFFLAVMATMANPFATLPVPPPDGRGINPLLTHPGMFFHPPPQMTGLVGVTIPFAFAMAHLLAGKRGDEWVEAGRFWGLVVWAILTLGILLGAWWAYTILGWGGYWFWDPVENAALMPWLPLTAFVHSIMVQRRRGMFRLWNIALINIAYALALYAMFMNRGGPVPSVHSFAQSTMGWVFLAFLVGNLAFSFGVFFWRYDSLRSAQRLESPVSREGAFLLNNLLLLAIAMVVLWGTVFPLISQAFRGVTITVARPFYDQVTGPIFLALVVLMGVGPLLPWRQASWANLRRALLLPTVVAVVLAVVLVALGMRRPLPILSFAVCALVATGIVREWVLGTRARHLKGENYLTAFLGLMAANRPRYGGYIVHLAMVVLAFSVTGSSFYMTQRDFSLLPGEEATVDGYTIRYIGANVVPRPDRVERSATVAVFKDGKPVTTLKPGFAFYPDFNMSATRAGIRSNPVEDFYVIASEFSDDGRAIFRVHINPLVWWMWVAGPIFLLGTAVSLWPERRRTVVSISELKAMAASAPRGES